MENKWLVPHLWGLQSQTIENIENSEVGDTVHIDETPVPVVVQDEGRYCLCAFTGEDKIPLEYKKKYAIVKSDVQDVWIQMCAVEHLLGEEIFLLIDSFDECQTLTKSQVQEFEKTPFA